MLGLETNAAQLSHGFNLGVGLGLAYTCFKLAELAASAALLALAAWLGWTNA